jgi:hypothetical protein
MAPVKLKHRPAQRPQTTLRNSAIQDDCKNRPGVALSLIAVIVGFDRCQRPSTRSVSRSTHAEVAGSNMSVTAKGWPLMDDDDVEPLETKRATRPADLKQKVYTSSLTRSQRSACWAPGQARGQKVRLSRHQHVVCSRIAPTDVNDCICTRGSTPPHVKTAWTTCAAHAGAALTPPAQRDSIFVTTSAR